MTTVVNTRLHPFDVYVGRAGHGHDGYFGNPHRLAKGEPRGETLDRYQEYLLERLEDDEEFARRFDELRGKTLGCFCVSQPWKPGDRGDLICHAQVMALQLEKRASR